MRRRVSRQLTVLVWVILQCGLFGGAVSETQVTAVELKYPIAPRGNQVDDFFGTKVADPYRWMEDVDSPATRTWVQAEAKLTSDYLAAIPGRNRIAQRLKDSSKSMAGPGSIGTTLDFKTSRYSWRLPIRKDQRG
jgi:hypothetical protein